MDRWQDDPARAPRIVGLLAEVQRFRRQLDAAVAIAGARDLDAWAQRRADERVPATRKGLDAAMYMALVDVSKPPIEDVAAAAGLTVAEVQAVRDRVDGGPPRLR